MMRRQSPLTDFSPKIWPKVWPKVWVVSDQRNDARLNALLERLPRGSGLIFRHYHLDPAERHRRFLELARIARRKSHAIALSGSARQARRWRAQAAYGSPEGLTQGPPLPRLITAHSLREIGQAHRARASAILLSPAFATRSHPGVQPLGPVRFRLMAARAEICVIALGGMSTRRARRLGWKKWAAIDGT